MLQIDIKGAVMIRFSTYKSILFIILAFIMIIVVACMNQEKNIPVLNYHQVEDNVDNPLTLSNQEFEKQMAYLSQHGYNAISPEQLILHMKDDTPLPDKPILITFDDGYRDNYSNAYPIMKKYGLKGTIFLITDFVGNNEWYLNWDQIRDMQQDGFMFESHTLNHVPLTTLTHEEILNQLIKSKEGIEWKLGTPVRYFAYPTGAYDKEIEELVRDSGYDGAFSVNFGRVSARSDMYALERIPIFKSRYTFYDFYLRLNFTFIADKLKTAVRSLRHIAYE
jgi:peptidoglycan/xylan/chitin deacetylase (PgdA/CDA1 family)